MRHIYCTSHCHNGQIVTHKMCGTAVIAINCNITNNVSIHSHDIKEDMQLAARVPSLHETVAGLELQFPLVKNLWNTIHVAEMLCQALEELLAPSKKTNFGHQLWHWSSRVIPFNGLYSWQHLFVCLFVSVF